MPVASFWIRLLAGVFLTGEGGVLAFRVFFARGGSTAVQPSSDSSSVSPLSVTGD